MVEPASKDEEELQSLYIWIDEIPLSRPKKSISRDFSDGVLLAEVVHHFFPRLVELHNYSSANALAHKMYNWNTLNTRVLRKLGCNFSKAEMEAVANCEPGAIEKVMKLTKDRLAAYVDKQTFKVTSREREDTVACTEYEWERSSGGESETTSSPYADQFKIGARPSSHNNNSFAHVLEEKDQLILELRETKQVLEAKVKKLEQLVRLKDAKIQNFATKLQAFEMAQ